MTTTMSRARMALRWMQQLVRRWRDAGTILVISVTDPQMADEILGYAKVELLRRRGLINESKSPNDKLSD